MHVLPPRSRPEEPEHPFVATVTYQGATFDMEHRPGDYREGTDDDGRPWRVRMAHWYGEVRGTKGADGDAVDVILKKDPDPFAPFVYVVQAKIPGSKRFDETKALLGFSNRAEAVAAFRAMYNRPGFFGGCTCWPIGAWLAAMMRPKVQGGPMRMVLKKARHERLRGGAGDGRPDSDFDDEELDQGRRHEKEHTNDPDVAEEIAKDHLSEDPDYYDKLQRMEKARRSAVDVDPLVELLRPRKVLVMHKARRHVKSYTRRTKDGKVVQVQQYDQSGRDARTKAATQPRARAAEPAQPQRRTRAADEEGGLITSQENALPKKALQPANTEAEVYAGAQKAQALQAQLLNEGTGLDKAIGAKVLRLDKGDAFDLSHDGPFIIIAPLKGKERAREKVAADYDGDWNQLSDIVRATVSVPSYDQVPEVMQKLRALGLQVAAKPKDRFSNPTAAGYRDLMMNVSYGDHVGELQVHVHSVLRVKDDAHKLYEKTRSIEAQMKTSGRTEYTPAEWAQVQEANQEMERMYGEAWNRALHGAPVGMAKAVKGHTKHFEYHGHHVEWVPGHVPMRIRKDGTREPIYGMERFYREAQPLGSSKMLMKARPSQKTLERHGQQSMFGGGGGPKATVKQHTRRSKTGKTMVVKQHQRTKKPAKPPSTPTAAPDKQALRSATWKNHTTATAKWGHLLDRYVGDEMLANMYIRRGDHDGLGLLIGDRKMVSQWLDRWAATEDDAVDLLNLRDDSGARTPQALDQLARDAGFDKSQRDTSVFDHPTRWWAEEGPVSRRWEMENLAKGGLRWRRPDGTTVSVYPERGGYRVAGPSGSSTVPTPAAAFGVLQNHVGRWEAKPEGHRFGKIRVERLPMEGRKGQHREHQFQWRVTWQKKGDTQQATYDPAARLGQGAWVDGTPLEAVQFIAHKTVPHAPFPELPKSLPPDARNDLVRGKYDDWTPRGY